MAYPKKCRGCGAEMMMVATSTGSWIPVDAATFTPGDTRFDPKKHTSHFATCPKAGDFRKGKNG